MKYKKNDDLELNFKIPTKEDFEFNKREYNPLSFSKYLEFVELGIKMCSDVTETRKHNKRNAPTVRFTL